MPLTNIIAGSLAARDLRTGTQKILVRGGSDAHFVAAAAAAQPGTPKGVCPALLSYQALTVDSLLR